MELNLSGHVAVVTGGASGIGRATAEAFAAEGSNIAIWDINEDAASVAAEIAERDGTQSIAISVDVTDESAVRDAVEQTVDKIGAINHLFHSAAIGSGKFGFPFTNLEPRDWPKVLDVNILGMVNVAHAVAPGMVERKAGTMLFIASVAGQIGSPTDPPYSAAKAANINFAQCIAKDLAQHGIRVNTVCPGMVKTPLNESVWKAWHDQQPDDQRISYEEWADDKIRNVIPLRRWQSPEDIANMAVFLASDKAANITGQTINIDGGFVMHW